MEHALEPTSDPAWVFFVEGYDPLREPSVESRFAISNGFLGVRAARALTRGARWVVPARTYVAGLFDTPAGERSVPGLVPAADWLQVSISLAGGPLVHDPGDVSSHRSSLDVRRGVLLSESRRLKAPGTDVPDFNVHVRTLRLVSLGQREIGLQLMRFEIQKGEMEVTFEASFGGMTLGLASERLDKTLGVWRTLQSGKSLAMASESSLWIDGDELPPAKVGELRRSWTWMCRPGQIVCFERSVAVVRSDTHGADPGEDAQNKLGIARRLGWRGVIAQHEAAWSQRWRRSDVEIEGDAAAQQALRFAIYHLNSAANPADEHVSIGARALTGDDYRGHVFWDTEIYLLPFYVMTWPEAARSLLMYRFHTLDGARRKAARMGWKGALYAWESADTGDDTTPDYVVGPDQRVVPVLCGKQEQHISADVAYAVWQYWSATGDEKFLLDAGAEILLETARFWSSRAELEADGKRHIRGVIGPDEYHEHIDDSAFTNVMARWNIRRAIDMAALLRERWPERWASLASSLKLTDEELLLWAKSAETIVTGLDPKTGLFEQFTGFFGLEDINLADYAARTVPMDVILGRERVQQSQIVKQADIVALLGLLPEEFAGDAGAENFRYYERRCSHGSSLSRAMHGFVAARLGLSEMALSFLRQTAAIDLGDTRVAVDGGIHIAALGGVWLTTVFGFAGLSLRDDGLALDPRLPPDWKQLGFSVQWRGRSLHIRITQVERSIEVTMGSGQPMTLFVSGEPHALHADQKLLVSFGGHELKHAG